MDGYISVSTEQHDEDTETQHGHVKTDHLSNTQLILRRGLTMFVAVALLAVAVCVRFLVPLPENLSVQANFTMDGINTTYLPDVILSTVLSS